MPKLIVKKGNIDRADPYRAVLTDTAPQDLPIMVSNDGLHNNLTRKATSPDLSNIVAKLVTSNGQPYTIPYRYRIRLTATASRQLSLAHPAAQANACRFYDDYGHLIPYFCRHGLISRRRPDRIGSAVSKLTLSSGRKQYKGSAIDTILQDQVLRNPGSFFAYAGYDRFHAFHSSDEFLELERKFPLMRTADVSKCFASVYSHTLAWAVKDVQHGKESTNAVSFANAFDETMRFANYNETSGIPVGWEVSRLFAEIILQAVDLAVVRRAERESLVIGRDFEIRRYIDDYAIFAISPDVADAIQRGLDDALGQFNLHLNTEKTRTILRPIQTPTSQLISRTRSSLKSLEELITQKLPNSLGIAPVEIRDRRAVLRHFVEEIKSACVDSGTSYEHVGPYLVSSLANLAESLIRSRRAARIQASRAQASYLSVFQCLVELSFLFHGLAPTVRSSYQVAQTTILSLRFFRKHFVDAWPSLEDTVRTQIQVIVDDPHQSAPKMSDYVPIELLNIVLAARELSRPFRVDVSKVVDRVLRSETLDYFSCVSLIFYHEGNDAGFTSKLESKLRHGFIPQAKPLRNSHDAHLVLDLICCPYLSTKMRLGLFAALKSNLQLGSGTVIDHSAAIQEMALNPWFVNWNEIDLLNHLRRKELAATY